MSPVAHVACLSLEDCLAIRGQVHVLKNDWEQKLLGVPFYTLGVASYLEAEPKKTIVYRSKARKFNPLLNRHFSMLYERVAAVLTKHLEKPVQYEELFGLPGFHIFLFNELFKKPMASLHFDLQFQSHKWPYRQIDYVRPLSFTLPIVLPRSGSGMYIWPFEYHLVRELPKKELMKMAEENTPDYVPYKVGEMIVHEGLHLHQIAPVPEMAEEDERITLQGHGLFCDGAWRLYW